MLRTRTFRVRRKSLRARYPHDYERTRNVLRPALSRETWLDLRPNFSQMNEMPILFQVEDDS